MRAQVRPVSAYAAPQLHTHVVIFNVTETADGSVRPLQPRQLYRSQQYATAIYRSELAARLTALGYDIEQGRSGQPEVRGYTSEYLEAASPRRQQIEAYPREEERHGAGAAQIAAHETREARVDVSHAEMQQPHRQLAERFGSQPEHVVRAAEAHEHRVDHQRARSSARIAVTFARDRNLEREAVVEDRRTDRGGRARHSDGGIQRRAAESRHAQPIVHGGQR